MLTKDEAVCIRTVDFSETSQIVTFFTKQTGKVSAIAKGAKRPRSPFGGPIEILAHGNIVFSDSGRDKLAALVEFEPVFTAESSSRLSSDMSALNCCLFAAEITNLLTEDYDTHPRLYDALLRLQQHVARPKSDNTAPPDIRASLIVFELDLLRDIGLSPIFSFCANCKLPFGPAWRRVFFSNGAKGLICPDCEHSFPDRIGLAADAAACLAGQKPLVSSGPQAISQAQMLLITYLTDIAGRPLRMAKYLPK